MLLFVKIAIQIDTKKPHIADEASLCCEADGTCHSENQRAPRRDRPNRYFNKPLLSLKRLSLKITNAKKPRHF